MHRDVESGAVQGIIDHNAAKPESEAAGALTGAMASVSMDDLSNIDNDSQIEKELLEANDEDAGPMEIDPQNAQADAILDAELQEKVEVEDKNSSETKNGENLDPDSGPGTPQIKIEAGVSPVPSAVPANAEKGFQNDSDSTAPITGGASGGPSSDGVNSSSDNDTQKGFQNDASKAQGQAANGADSDGDVVMAPTVFGSFTMADLTVQNPTDAELILIDSFQGSIKLLLDILGIR